MHAISGQVPQSRLLQRHTYETTGVYNNSTLYYRNLGNKYLFQRWRKKKFAEIITYFESYIHLKSPILRL